MSLIQADHLTFAYPESPDTVFEDVSFQIDTEWNLGLVGRNGRGKTTLLRLLDGTEDGFTGQLRGVPPCTYFPSAVSSETGTLLDVMRAAAPEAADWQILCELGGLELEEDLLERPFQSLSGGEKTRALLAALFLQNGAYPLIDEPTNHLDADGREILAAYLRSKRGFILVSHDRAFLDDSVDHVLAICRTGFEVRRGGFSGWHKEFEERQVAELSRNARLKKEISRLEISARRADSWSQKTEKTKKGAYDSGYVGHKAAKMMKRSKSIAARRERAAEEKSTLLHDLEKADDLRLSPLVHPKEILIAAEDFAPVYDGRAVCEPVSFTLRHSERLFLTGENGCGKSSILKVLTGEHTEHMGTVLKASGLRISVVPQDTSHLTGPLRGFPETSGIDTTQFLTILRKAGFDREDFERNMEDLSEGQKKKILLGASLCTNAHLYIWDEPANYMDIYSRMQLEQAILSSGASMILVEHDRAFREAVETGELRITKARI